MSFMEANLRRMANAGSLMKQGIDAAQKDKEINLDFYGRMAKNISDTGSDIAGIVAAKKHQERQHGHEAEQADLGREFTTSERLGKQDWETEERLGEQGWRGIENQADRKNAYDIALLREQGDWNRFYLGMEKDSQARIAEIFYEALEATARAEEAWDDMLFSFAQDYDWAKNEGRATAQFNRFIMGTKATNEEKALLMEIWEDYVNTRRNDSLPDEEKKERTRGTGLWESVYNFFVPNTYRAKMEGRESRQAERQQQENLQTIENVPPVNTNNLSTLQSTERGIGVETEEQRRQRLEAEKYAALQEAYLRAAQEMAEQQAAPPPPASSSGARRKR